MSIPNQETVFGTIEFQGEIYDLLSQPLSDKQFDKISKYKKDNNCGNSSAPWSVNKYKWVIEKDKLYLTDIYFKLCEDKSNHMKKIFNTDKMFAIWVNREIKLLVSKEDINDNKAKRKVIIFNIQNGLVVNQTNSMEEYTIRKLRKYFI
ncbi:MAG: hypothetical protein U9Q33_04730 [Campylobacterota bacterium]|nr:hypothetical protein [Campylobacterota bacterium]